MRRIFGDVLVLTMKAILRLKRLLIIFPVIGVSWNRKVGLVGT